MCQMKKTIIISAINFFEGGPLSILKDCISYLEENLTDKYDVIIFVHKATLLQSNKIKFVELPKSRKSYLYRFYYEYIWFYFESLRVKPYLWFSLHDMTPNVNAKIRAVYCHNPSPFYKITRREFFIEPTLGLFNLFYGFLYRININKNMFVVVQQNWLRNEFRNRLNVKSKIIVAPPNVRIDTIKIETKSSPVAKPIFFFPALPRVFKNFECICEAARILNARKLDFELHITLLGNENKYSNLLFKEFGCVDNIKFIGLLPRDKVFEMFEKSIALVFPSKLETWGLPITEAKLFNKPILVSNLPYAHETVGTYSKVSFFEPNDSLVLADLMEQLIKNTIIYDGNTAIKIDSPIANNWEEIFKLLLNN